jgi:hypothetical protein
MDLPIVKKVISAVEATTKIKWYCNPPWEEVYRYIYLKNI